MAKAVAPLAASARVPAPLVSGARKATSTEPPCQRGALRLARGRDLGHHVGLPRGAEGRPRGLEPRVGEARRGARAGLQDDHVALGGELADHVRDEGDAPLALRRLPGHADPHSRRQGIRPPGRPATVDRTVWSARGDRGPAAAQRCCSVPGHDRQRRRAPLLHRDGEAVLQRGLLHLRGGRGDADRVRPGDHPGRLLALDPRRGHEPRARRRACAAGSPSPSSMVMRVPARSIRA